VDHIDRLLCPLPLKIEPYSGCSGRCAYCSISGLRQAKGGSGRGLGTAANNMKYIERFFRESGHSMERELIDMLSPVQIGVMSDPLQPAEGKHKVTLSILKLLADHQYPCLLTTKFPGLLTQPEYLKAIEGLPW
jgi:DNA repair photolyase